MIEFDSTRLAPETEAVGPAPEYRHNPRVADLMKRLGILGMPPEEDYDRFTRLASKLFGAPVALMSLLDEDRQYFKSLVGLNSEVAAKRETPLTHSFCKHVVASGQPLIIRDATKHAWVDENLAIRDLGVIAYAGIPMTTMSGDVLGSFCLIDTQPREWTQDEIDLLKDLTQAVVAQIEYRERIGEMSRLRELVKKLPDALEELVEHLHGLTKLLGDNTDEYVRRFVVRAEDRVSRLTKLEKEISDSIENGPSAQGPKWVDLASVVADVVEAAETAAEDTPIEKAYASGPMWLNCDTSGLTQGLSDILLDIATHSEGAVSVSLTRKGNEAAVQIASRGRGVSPSTLMKSVTEFSALPYAVSAGTRRGIKTNISGKRVDIQGSCFEASSSQEGGTLFTLRLPLYDQPSPSTTVENESGLAHVSVN